MAEAKEEIKDEVRAETINDDNYLKFTKPFKWEDKTYDGLDLKKLENVRTDALIDMKRELTNSGFVSPTPELDLEYCCHFAAIALDLPFEFFLALPAKESSRLRVRVSNFLLATD